MKENIIKKITGKEILDSRKNPTVEVSLFTEKGVFKAAVPSGASTGKNEAIELRDGGKRLKGKGVLRAVGNINKIIGPQLKGKNVSNQKEIDNFLIRLDGTKNKSKLGANAICGVSVAVCRAGASANNIPLWKHISLIAEEGPSLPVPCFNIINGGAHAGNDLDFQEFMV
ncbi:MAG: phosphopyruvate hydratase, partial [Parcubacteria group bacterium]